MNSESEANDNSKDYKHFAVPYSLDPERFFRLQCSSCDREFKVLAEAISMADSLSPAFKQIEVEHGISLSTSEEVATETTPNHLTCPYCGHRDEPSHFNTPEFVDHAVRWMNRELVYEILNQFSRDLDNIFNRGSHGRRGGFISIKLEYTHRTPPKPVRPISGPELPDMKRVEVLCCGKMIKITDGWGTSIFCPYCSQELILQ